MVFRQHFAVQRAELTYKTYI